MRSTWVAPRNVLEAAFRQGVKKFIYCSTCGVHGNIDHPPGGEDAPIQPADYYQATKYEAEPVVNEYYKKGMKTVILQAGGHLWARGSRAVLYDLQKGGQRKLPHVREREDFLSSSLY